MQMRSIKWFIPLLLAACGGSESYVPKPRAYPRLNLPENAYRPWDSAGVPYKFEIPVYTAMEKDTTGVYTSQPYWFNLNFKPFNATLHITYYRFSGWDQFDSLVDDTRRLVNKHIQRAEEIEEIPLSPSPGVSGLMFDIRGNTATNLNFYLTDSSRNFFRGALYFNRQAASDSIAPVFDYMKKDVNNLIRTFRWK